MVSLSAFAKDTIPPTITLNYGKNQNVLIASVFLINEPKSVSDNLTDSGDIIVRTSWLFGPVNSMKRGTYVLLIEAEDTSGNISRDTINYKVDDFWAPDINLNTANTVCTELGKPYNRVLPTVTDNYYSSNQISLVLKSSDVNVYVAGSYTDVYEATDGSGNKTTKTRVVIVQAKCNTDIADVNSSNKIKLYPNPANTKLQIESQLALTNSKIYIYSLTGTLILSVDFVDELDVSALYNGLYVICIKNDTETYNSILNIAHY